MSKPRPLPFPFYYLRDCFDLDVRCAGGSGHFIISKNRGKAWNTAYAGTIAGTPSARRTGGLDLMIAIAIALSVAMVAACSSAKAHDFARDLLCSVSGTDGSPIVAWSFATNTRNMDGSVGGTMIETSVHSHGRDLSAAPGSRPIWVFESNPDGGLMLTSRSDPGWSIVAPRFVDSGHGTLSGRATVYHNGTAIGEGICARQYAPPNLPNAATVPDLGGD